MPGFEEHRKESLRWFKWFTAILVIAIWQMFSFPTTLILAFILFSVSLPAVRAGAMFPDIDHPCSRPRRYLLLSIPILGLLTAGVISVQQRNREENILRTMAKLVIHSIGGYLIGIGVRKAIDYVLRRWVKHRGPTHRTSTGGALALGIGAALFTVLRDTAFRSFAFILSPVAVIYFFGGHLSHLYLDQKKGRDGYRIRL